MPKNYTDKGKITEELGWLDNKERNKAEYARICGVGEDITSELKAVHTVGYRLLKETINEDKFKIAFVSDVAEEVVYFVVCNVWLEVSLNAKPVTQLLLWRTQSIKHRMVTQGFAERMFRDVLLETYNIIASDSHQTNHGRRFWVQQVGMALEMGEYVYRFDRMEGKSERITDHDKVIEDSGYIWGDDDKYVNILLVISKDELPAKQPAAE